MADVSIIVPCKNEGDFIQMTVDSIVEAKCDLSYQLLVVDDGSQDGCCDFLKNDKYPVKLLTTPGLGASQARNFGAEKSIGDVLVFCDGHVLVEDNWLDRLVECTSRGVDAVSPAIAAIGQRGAVGYGQTWNERLENKWLPRRALGAYAVPLLPGGCMAVRREAFGMTGGFDDGFKVWGHEDEEISLKLWLFGYKLYVHTEVIVQHQFRPRHPYPVKLNQVQYNFLRMIFSHLSSLRISKVLEFYRDKHDFFKVLTDVMLSDVWEQRQKFLNERSRSDAWFFRRFNIPL